MLRWLFHSTISPTLFLPAPTLSSLPHSTQTSPVESASSRRGARLDEDFVSPSANEPGEEGSPHSSVGVVSANVGVVSDVHQLTESRLSDVSLHEYR